MKEYFIPEIKSYTSEEILELIGPAETQYQYVFNEDFSLVLGVDTWNFSAEAGTNVTAIGVPSASLDIIILVDENPPAGPTVCTANAAGDGGSETCSVTIPSTGPYLIQVYNVLVGSYTLTISSDRPLSSLIMVNDQ